MALTPESIAETWSNGGTVQIATPADLNVFNTYLQSNYTAETMRYAEITSDLDFEDGEITFTSMYPPSGQNITNLAIDGNNHIIKGIVEDNFTASGILFFGDVSTSLSNVIVNKCNISYTGNSNCYIIQAGSVNNVKVDHCRFSITSNRYYGLRAESIANYASAVTVYCNNGGEYYGVSTFNTASSGKRIAILDTVYRNEEGGIAYALNVPNYSNFSLVFTRNRFYNFRTVYGFYRFGYYSTISNGYAAITAENATTIRPLGDGYYTLTMCYYDNILLPNASTSTDLGLTTAELQSVATMTAKGFAVEEA